MKPFLTLCFLLFQYLNVMASCIALPDTAAVLDKWYDFIAVIKVKGVLPNPSDKDFKYDILYEAGEVYKGVAPDRITVSSGHPDFTKVRSSNDIVLVQNKEYLVFGRVAGKETIINFCGIVSLLNENQLEDYGAGSAFARIDSLRHFYKKTLKPPVENGVYKEYYPGGALKAVITYRNGLKHGSVKRYRPDGRIYISENYQNGKPHGKQVKDNTYNSYVMHFRNGKRTGKTVYYDTEGNVTSEQVYKESFGVVSSRYYSDGYLVQAMDLDEATGIKTYRRYKQKELVETVKYDSKGKKISP